MNTNEQLTPQEPITMPTEDTRVRAESSASCLHRRQICPGSEKAESGLPDESTEFSREGDLLHWHDANPDVPRKQLTHEQRGILDRNNWLRNEYIRRQLIAAGLDPKSEPVIYREYEMFLCDKDGFPVKPIFPGHADIIYYFPQFRLCFIFDSKFGRNPVPRADVNMQLRCYVVMAAENIDADKYHVAITQPWLAAPDDITAACYDANTLPEYKEEIFQILAGCRNPNAPRIPSSEACQYCKAKAYCPEAMAIVTQLAVVRIAEMSIEELEAMGPECEQAQRVIDARERRLKYVLERNPELVKRYELSKEQKTREINDPYEAFTILFDVGLLGKDREEALKQWFSICSASRNQAEHLMAKINNLTIEQTKAMVTSALGPIIEEKTKARSLVLKKEVKK